MKGKVAGLLVVVAVVSFGLYRHITVSAMTTVSSSASEVCGKTKEKLECNAEAAMIDSGYNSCVKACPTKTDWYKYCTKTSDSCEADCELLNIDGKSAAKVKACKEECAKQEAQCKASYRDKGQCISECDTVKQKAQADFIQRRKAKK